MVSAYPGTIGLDPEQQVEDHALYGLSNEEYQEWSELFAGCPGLDSGAFVVGEVRLFGISDPITDESPTTSTGRVTAYGADGQVWAGCYLDDEGLAYDPDASFTGATGLFLVPGVPVGLHDLVVEVLIGPDTWTLDVYPLRITAGPQMVSPWWPLWAWLSI
jgi:hypothetical protein